MNAVKMLIHDQSLKAASSNSLPADGHFREQDCTNQEKIFTLVPCFAEQADLQGGPQLDCV